jgi:hypothetical protein
MKSWASVLPQWEDRREGARRIAFQCGPVVRLSALRLPSFKGGVFGNAFGLAFLGVSKARVRRGIATTKKLVIAGLDPAIHGLRGALIGPNCTRPVSMDHRVKPGGDEVSGQARW